jgi:DNA-directed RNA polymerase beta subunit
MLKDKYFLNKRIEFLDQYNRSNQDTSLVHKPAVNIGEWVEAGDLLADSSASMNGELAIGKNIVVAYMPWEGFNYEDAILINERLVYDDVYTSIHVERYEIETKDGLNGSEQITREIPDISPEAISHLDSMGIAKIGSWIEEGTILVGKVTPVDKKAQTPYQRLLFKLLEKNISNVRDSSLRAPKGIKANVIYVNILAREDMDSGLLNSKFKKIEAELKISKTSLPTKNSTKPNTFLAPIGAKAFASLDANLVTKTLKYKNGSVPNVLNNPNHQTKLDNSKFSASGASQFGRLKKWLNKKTLVAHQTVKDWKAQACAFHSTTSCFANKKIRKNTREFICFSNKNSSNLCVFNTNRYFFATHKNGVSDLEASKFVSKLNSILPAGKIQKTATSFLTTSTNKKGSTKNVFYSGSKELEQNRNSLNGIDKVKQIPTNVHIYLAEKRKIQVGDKMAGRHGNKGIISNILPREDMPYLPDGTPIDIVLNPLGVPSRMNVGQIYECLLGLAGKNLGEHYKINPFDEMYGAEASRSFVFSKLFEASKKTGIEWLFDPNSPGKMRIFDGRTSESFDQPVTVGIAYMLKLVHMVDDKVHARSTGPYSLVTQQPLRGRAKQGGQRLGEMEVWAIEGYGAAFVLLEMLTLKSDDMTGRLTLWSNLILNKEITIGTPESFKVLVCELQALCLDIGLFHYSSNNKISNMHHQVVNSGSNLLGVNLPVGAKQELNQNLTDSKSNQTKQQLFLKEISHLMLLP